MLTKRHKISFDKKWYIMVQCATPETHDMPISEQK